MSGPMNPTQLYKASSLGISNEVNGTYVYGVIFVTQNEIKILVNSQYPPDDEEHWDVADAAIEEVKQRVHKFIPDRSILTCEAEEVDLDSQSCEDEFDRQERAAYQAIVDKQLLVCHVERIPGFAVSRS